MSIATIEGRKAANDVATCISATALVPEVAAPEAKMLAMEARTYGVVQPALSLDHRTVLHRRARSS